MTGTPAPIPSRFDGFGVTVFIPEVMRPFIDPDPARAAASYLSAIVDALGVDLAEHDSVAFKLAWGASLRASFTASPAAYCAPDRSVLVSTPAFWLGILSAVSSMLQIQTRELHVAPSPPSVTA